MLHVGLFYLKNKKRNNLNCFLFAPYKSKVARSPFEWKKTLDFLVFRLGGCILPSVKEQKSTSLQNWSFFLELKKLKVFPRKLKSVLVLFCSGTMKNNSHFENKTKCLLINSNKRNRPKQLGNKRKPEKKTRAWTKCRQRKVFFFSSPKNEKIFCS